MSQLRPITPVENAIVETERLRKVYGSGDLSVTALHDVDITFGRGQFTAIMGPSGSGKSTLMHCTAGLDSISSGVVKVNGAMVSSMSAAQRTVFRRDNVGFIFQAFNLIPSLSAEENITLPTDIAGRKIDRDRFDAVISALGIGNRLKHRPAELSGGQQQRVACARALVADAAVVFADEPTGNLDSEASDAVLGFIRYAVDELGQSVIMVTHEPTAAAWADRVVFLRDGDVHAEMRSPNTDSVLDALRTFSVKGRELELANGPATNKHTAGFLGTASPSAPSQAGLTPIDFGAPAATPVMLDRDANGDKAFHIPGLGRVTVSGDVHVHVYDPSKEDPQTSAPHQGADNPAVATTDGEQGASGHEPSAGDGPESGAVNPLVSPSEDAPTVPPPGANQEAQGQNDTNMPVEQYGYVRGGEDV